MTRVALLVTCLVAILSGCATSKFEIKNVNLAAGAQTVDMLLEPYQTLGVMNTPAIQKGEVTTFSGIFAEIRFGEYFPGRVRWNVLGASPDGREYYGQSVFSGIVYSGQFLERIVMDGILPPEAKVMVLSSDLNFAYDLGGQEYPLEKGEIADPKSRAEFILKNGSKVGERKKSPEILSDIRKWNRYTIPQGKFLSPLTKEDLEEIAKINPKYSYSEKLVASGDFALVLSETGFLVGIALDLLRARNVPSEGWDYNSELPSRRNIAFIASYALSLKQRMIEEVNRQNAILTTTKRSAP